MPVFKYSWWWAPDARNMYSESAEIKPAQCSITLVFYLTYTMTHGNTKVKFGDNLIWGIVPDHTRRLLHAVPTKAEKAGTKLRGPGTRIIFIRFCHCLVQINPFRSSPSQGTFLHSVDDSGTDFFFFSQPALARRGGGAEKKIFRRDPNPFFAALTTLS